MINILIMGAGLIGHRHVKLVNANDRCHLVGVIETDASRHLDDGNRYFTSLDEVDSPVDGVIIATPTNLHYECAQQAIKRGWHMLIEKPVTATPDEAAALAEEIAPSGLHCLVGHHRRYHQSILTLRDWVSCGALGELMTSSMIWAMRKPDDYFEGNWRNRDGSPVMINTIHDIDLMRFVLGDITDMVGVASDNIRQSGRVETAAVALRFASGLCGTIALSDSATSPWSFEAGTGENPTIGTTGQDMWWITGTKGSVSFPSLTRWGDADDWSQPALPTAYDYEATIPLIAQLNHFIAVIKGEEAPLITVQDAGASLIATWQLQQSLQSQLAL